MQTLKAGTRIEVKGCAAMGGFPAVPPQRATICRWTKASGPRPNHLHPDRDTSGGWHVVLFDDGEAKLLAHESSFRIIDNRC